MRLMGLDFIADTRAIFSMCCPGDTRRENDDDYGNEDEDEDDQREGEIAKGWRRVEGGEKCFPFVRIGMSMFDFEHRSK